MNAPDKNLLISRATFDEVIIGVYQPSEMILERGQGSRVWDREGRDYLDLAGGIAVTSLGHAHPTLISALTEQANKLWLVSNYFVTEPPLRLARKLIQATFADKVFFCNSGAEANEAALKLARRHASEHYGPEKTEIVSCLNSFHGRTLFTVTAGGTEKYKKGYAPLPSGISHIPYNDSAALEKAVTARTCAVILEPLQGEGGVNSATAEFLSTARRLCDQHQALLIFDEVQSGNGRTGTLYNYMQKSVTPDILSTAKGLGGGFPIGAMLTTAAIAASFTVGSHGTTYGGNPLACAVAEAAFDIINTPAVLQGVLAKHARFKAGLQAINDKHAIFREIRGEGLLMGCELVEAWHNRAKTFMKAGEKNGLLFLTAGDNVLRFAPSLIIPDSDLDEALRRLATTVMSIINQG